MCVLPDCAGEAATRFELARFDVCVCRACGIMFRRPLPSDAELRAMYEDPDYHASSYFTERAASELDRSPEMRIYRAGLDVLDELVVPDRERARTLLDVGCGNGTFMALARARGWDIGGVELSERLASATAARLDVPIACGQFTSVALDRPRYDAITMWDVLEHVRDPVAVLARARELLRPSGCLLILTIDSSSLFNLIGEAVYRMSLGRLRRQVELLYDARHNYYFDRRSLGRLLDRAGFEIVVRQHYRAYLGRWLSEPAPAWLRLGGDVVDQVSRLAGRQYRQLLLCR